MPIRKEIDENFRFLILEVRSQLQDAQRVLAEPGSISAEKLDSRDDYIDNLKGVIESKCFSLIYDASSTSVDETGSLNTATIDLMKSVIVITSNLERIADFANNLVGQTQYLKTPTVFARYDPAPIFDTIFKAYDLIQNAVVARDIQKALLICKSETEVDTRYEEVFRRLLDELRQTDQPEDYVTAIFIFRYLERIGDCLLNIGEAIISAAVGEKLKIHQFEALEESLESAALPGSVSDLDLESIWETRSGCRIARVQGKRGADAGAAIFKDGKLRKLQEEKENIERWQEIIPGLPPKIYGFETHGDHCSLLLEYFQGNTVKDMLLRSKSDLLGAALEALKTTLVKAWATTLKQETVNAGFFAQLKARIDDIHKVHPNYRLPVNHIGSLEAPSFEDLLERAVHLENQLDAPFSVFIHGDFNVDNVIYSHSEDRIHFIDLHRSRQSDYVQDVSVFMVSAYRLPIFKRGERADLNRTINELLKFSREFAVKHDDIGFEARLTLGLIRSFATSTRFELEEKFAKSMYMRATFLLEKMLDHDGKPWEQFKLPEQALIY